MGRVLRYMLGAERLNSDTRHRNRRCCLPTAGTSSEAQKKVSTFQLVLQKMVYLILLTAIWGIECGYYYFNFTHQEVPAQGNEVNEWSIWHRGQMHSRDEDADSRVPPKPVQEAVP